MMVWLHLNRDKDHLCPARYLPGGQTQGLNVPLIKRIDHYAADSDEDSAPESISDTGNWLDYDRDLNIPNDSENDWEPDNVSDI